MNIKRADKTIKSYLPELEGVVLWLCMLGLYPNSLARSRTWIGRAKAYYDYHYTTRLNSKDRDKTLPLHTKGGEIWITMYPKAKKGI